MYAIATFVVVAVVTLIFVRVATGALIATGTPPEVAAFQARSAFSGAGFTTSETENVVNHPVRRRIIATTMFVGSVGTPTLVVAVLVGFLGPGPGGTEQRTIVLVSCVVLALLILGNRPINHLLVDVGRRYTHRRLLSAFSGRADELLTIGDEYVVIEASVDEPPEAAPRSLRGLEQALPGVRVLGVWRATGKSPEYVGESPIDVTLHTDDRLVLYGSRERLAELGLIG